MSDGGDCGVAGDDGYLYLIPSDPLICDKLSWREGITDRSAGKGEWPRRVSILYVILAVPFYCRVFFRKQPENGDTKELSDNATVCKFK